MATSDLRETFDDNTLPAWMSNAAVGDASIVVSGGILHMVAGTGAGDNAMVTSAATHTFDQFFTSFYPMPVEPFAVAFNWLDASLNGYGLGVGTSSETPGDAELRVNRFAGGSLSHPYSTPYSATNHRWFRTIISGSNIVFQVAPDHADGISTGSWTTHHTIAYAGDTGYSTTGNTMYMYSDNSNGNFDGKTGLVNSINTTKTAIGGGGGIIHYDSYISSHFILPF